MVNERDPEVRQLLRHLRAIGDADRARDYLTAARLLIESLGLDSNDLRLNTSIPKSTSKWILPITINSRYVLTTERVDRQLLTTVIWGPLYDRIPRIQRLAVSIWRFSPHRGEDVLETPWLVGVENPAVLLNDEELREGWLEAVRRELERISASPYRRHHSHVAYRLIVDTEFRETLLKAVFG